MQDEPSSSNENKEASPKIDLGISKDILLGEKQFTQELRFKVFQTIVTAIVVTLVPTIVSRRVRSQMQLLPLHRSIFGGRTMHID